MGMEMKLQMRMAQRLVMTPMLQQAIKLLPMTRLELIQSIRQELEENPMLDETLDQETDEAEEESTEHDTSLDDPPGEEPKTGEEETVFEEQSTLENKEEEASKDEIDWDAYIQEEIYEGSTGEGYEDRPSLDSTLRHKDSLEDHLLWQLNFSALTDEERNLGDIIIGNLNDEGYLDQDIESLASENNVTTDEIEDGLALVQSFDPPGVAARNLTECLLLQALVGGYKGTLVEDLIRNHIEELYERNFQRLAKKLSVSMDDLVDAARAIREFDPKPGSEFSAEDAHYITPDIFVIKMDDDYQVFLNDDGIPRLRINHAYHSILKDKTQSKEKTREFLETKYRSAIWMIKSIEQRRQTMLKVGRSICKFQRDFLDKGIDFLNPLVLKDVATDIEMHESTISRVTTNKYIHTPQGLFELKYFFHSSVGSAGGGDMSSVRVREMIKKLVKEENQEKPLTDDQIVKLLEKQDVKIARRTITKYRKELGIPSTSKRRKLYL